MENQATIITSKAAFEKRQAIDKSRRMVIGSTVLLIGSILGLMLQLVVFGLPPEYLDPSKTIAGTIAATASFSIGMFLFVHTVIKHIELVIELNSASNSK